ncbi:MAG: efflux RND transporter permease subunit [Gemmatimonadetes bacterium]|nr:efflux RND transporter permease subunit [Gemmatimonadota bacterium]
MALLQVGERLRAEREPKNLNGEHEAMWTFMLYLNTKIDHLILLVLAASIGIIGAIIGHWIMGVTLTILSILGLMALTGVVINDSLILVDFINQRHRNAGEKLLSAVERAGVVRFRPVMLTSITTFFGLLPLLMDQSSSAQFLVPMAVSLGFGILFATMITLILIPTNIMIADDIAQYFKSKISDIRGAITTD